MATVRTSLLDDSWLAQAHPITQLAPIIPTTDGSDEHDDESNDERDAENGIEIERESAPLGEMLDPLAGAQLPPALSAPNHQQPVMPPPAAPVDFAECEQFIRDHERAVLNYLWRMLGDEETAYDLTQEVFLRAWSHFETIRYYEQPRSWLFRVATNLALTHLRRRTRQGGHTALLDPTDSGTHPAESDHTWRLAERDLVRQTLLLLPPRRRAVLILREVYGLSAAEAGRALGMTETAVRMALHRAREQFRELYLRASPGSRKLPAKAQHNHAELSDQPAQEGDASHDE